MIERDGLDYGWEKGTYAEEVDYQVSENKSSSVEAIRHLSRGPSQSFPSLSISQLTNLSTMLWLI